MADTSVTSSAARDNDRQLDEMKSAHEKKMAQLRAKQQKEEAQARDAGEAAVNHIRKTNDDRIAQARAEADSKSEREGESLAKTYAALKHRANEANSTTEKEITASREHADQTIESDRRREDQALAQNQEKLKDFLAKQRDLRAATERKYADETRETEQRHTSTIRKANDDSARELRQLESDHKERLHELGEDNKSTYEEAKQQAALRLSQLRRDNDMKLKHEIDQDNDSFQRVHQKAHDDVVKTQSLGQARLSKSIEENQRKLETDREKSITLNEKLQREYSRESQRVEMEGNADVEARKEKFNHVLTEQKLEQKEELKGLSQDFETKEKRVQNEGESHIKQSVTKLRDTLHRKEDEFQRQFASEDKANHESLSAQKEVFLKEQYKQQRRQDDLLHLDEIRKGDQFYKPQSFNASLSEHEDKYVLTAKVPAHEKDNVEVRVKDGKVTLSSARQYNNAIKDGETRMETSTHQSYRQEIALPKPADAKHVITSISDDGTIRSIIPKKGFGRLT